MRPAEITRVNIPGWHWDHLEEAEMFVVGLGAVGGPFCEAMQSVGARSFVLCDPKRYSSQSLSQCDPSEVGQFKARCVGRRLRDRGAKVIAFPTAVERLEPGWAGPKSVVVVCGDNLAVQRSAHEIAFLLQRPLVKVNLETAYLLASIRFWDYSEPSVSSCLLCSWPPEFFSQQKVTLSCDGQGREEEPRRTNSPRALSAFTASWAALLVASTIALKGFSAKLCSQEAIFSPLGASLCFTDLPPDPDCVTEHEARGRLLRLDEKPNEVTLGDLAKRGGIGKRRSLWVSGWNVRLVTRCRCKSCDRVEKGWWWVREPGRPVRICSCGGAMFEVPLDTVISAERRELGAAWQQPLSTLGVRARAAVLLQSEEEKTTFVIG